MDLRPPWAAAGLCDRIHLVEEWARHNGNADLIRQAIDGTTGNRNGATGAMPPEVSEISVRQSEVSEAARTALEPSVEVVGYCAEGGRDVAAEGGTVHECHRRRAD